MEGIPGNYGGITLFNVIIIYHKRMKQKGESRRPPAASRAQDGLPYERMRSYGRSYGMAAASPGRLLLPVPSDRETDAHNHQKRIQKKNPSLRIHPEGELARRRSPSSPPRARGRRHHHHCHHHHHPHPSPSRCNIGTLVDHLVCYSFESSMFIITAFMMFAAPMYE